MKNRARLSQATSFKKPKRRDKQWKSLVCYPFSYGRKCSRENCKFLYLCYDCDGAHSYSSCPQKGQLIMDVTPCHIKLCSCQNVILCIETITIHCLHLACLFSLSLVFSCPIITHTVVNHEVTRVTTRERAQKEQKNGARGLHSQTVKYILVDLGLYSLLLHCLLSKIKR